MNAENAGIDVHRAMEPNAMVASASDVAAWLAGERSVGSPEMQDFGKRFERAYQQTCWKWQSIFYMIDKLGDDAAMFSFGNTRPGDGWDGTCPACGNKAPDRDENARWCVRCNRVWHQECKPRPVLVHDNETGKKVHFCVECFGPVLEHSFLAMMQCADAVDIMRAFVLAGVRGMNPPTAYRLVKPGYYVSAKPDLKDWKGTIFEYKIYCPDAYAIMQSRVFSWVLGMPVVLAWWDHHAMTFGKRVVHAGDLSISIDIPDDIFSPAFVDPANIKHSLT